MSTTPLIGNAAFYSTLTPNAKTVFATPLGDCKSHTASESSSLMSDCVSETQLNASYLEEASLRVETNAGQFIEAEKVKSIAKVENGPAVRWVSHNPYRLRVHAASKEADVPRMPEDAPDARPQNQCTAPATTNTNSAVMCCYFKQRGTCKMGAVCWHGHVGLESTPCHYGARCKAGHAHLVKPRPSASATKLDPTAVCRLCHASSLLLQVIPVYTGDRMERATRALCPACKGAFLL